MGYGYIVNLSTSVDIQELLKIGGKVMEIYEGVVYKDKYQFVQNINFWKIFRKNVCFKTKL